VKKMLICCGVLCMTLLLFCGTALADVKVDPGSDSSVTVKPDDKSQVFTVTKTGASDGQLYLVMIQKGDATAKPTAENLYYLNVEKASGTTFTMQAYPKDLDDGTYVVYLSDYSGSNNGARKQVATITVDGNGDILYGDVNGDTKVNGKDRIILSRFLAGWSEYGEDKTDENYKVIKDNADVNQDSKVNGKDRIILSRHLAGWAEYQTIPMPES